MYIDLQLMTSINILAIIVPDPSPQSGSPSHFHWLGIQSRSDLHWNDLGPHTGWCGASVVVLSSALLSVVLVSLTTVWRQIWLILESKVGDGTQRSVSAHVVLTWQGCLGMSGWRSVVIISNQKMTWCSCVLKYTLGSEVSDWMFAPYNSLVRRSLQKIRPWS